MNRALFLSRAARGSSSLLFRSNVPVTAGATSCLSHVKGLHTHSPLAKTLRAGPVSAFGKLDSTWYDQYAKSTGPLKLFSSSSRKTVNGNGNEAYHWIDDEAQELIAKAYKRHKALADKSRSYPPSLSVKDLEKTGVPFHYEPKDFIDRAMLRLMKGLRVFVHAFFREKYDHHAVCLETVAAVPGIVGSFHRHLRSLRRMQRDHGWIGVMQEEAENERMHLLIFMQVCKPTFLERSLVVTAQGLYLTFYSLMYLLNSRAAHRLTGYLEEEAHRNYTDYLHSLDEGKLENREAPQIAKDYYRLGPDARIREVVLHVRADEAMHRDVNHHFSNKYRQGDTDSAPEFMQERVVADKTSNEGFRDEGVAPDPYDEKKQRSGSA